MRMNYELSSGSTSLDVGRLAISFPAPNRNASEVQLRSVSSLFRRPNNRNQIRISVREKTAAVHFVVHQPISNEFSFFFTATGRPLSTAATKLLYRTWGPAIRQQRIVFASHYWTIGGRNAGHFDGPKRLLPFGSARFAGRREWNLSYDYFTLPTGSTKENEPTPFFHKLCLCRCLLGNRWTNIGSRSPASHSPKG